MKKPIIIIPTYNEEDNILKLYYKIIKNIKAEILYVDDNSNDNTQKIISKLKQKNKNVHCIFRPSKYGIGSAHKDGLRWCYKRKYTSVITMDGDGTHDPKYLKTMIKKLINFDLVISNRFIKKKSLRDWPIFRVFLTKMRHILISTFLDIKFDASGGLRCINTKKIKLNHLMSKSDDYSYFWENLYLLNKKNYKITEISINLPYRKKGSSKMKLSDIFNSLSYLIKFTIKNKIIN